MEFVLLFFFLCIIAGVFGVLWLYLRQKTTKLEAEIVALQRRVFRLERDLIAKIPASPEVTTKKEAPQPAAFPDFKHIEKQAEITETSTVEPPKVSAVSRAEEIPLPVNKPHAPGLGERLRDYVGNEGWEALVGGSLLNKVGALVLVIGIALFLGYSLTHMTPAGRALTSLGASVSLLGGGVFLERKRGYRVFARGLIGAGWAALYVTAYAIYALPAARLIENPYAGSFLLLLVAAGMIGHSLSYRVQAITAVAYFAGFAALGATPSSAFALISVVPLSASLLYLAWRFHWNAMGVFGAAATYASCIWRGSSGASLTGVESLLLVYWLLFEAFDLLRVRRRAMGWGLGLVFGLNAFGFLGISYHAWLAAAPDKLWIAEAFGAALYLASGVLRGFFRPKSSFSAADDLIARMRAGSYEAAITLAAGLTGLAIASRLLGIWLSAGLAIEAEILYLTGIFLNLGFLRWLGNIGFVFSLGQMVINGTTPPQVSAPVVSTPVYTWTPAALLHAIFFYVNRLLRQPNIVYSSLAAALIAGVLAQELPGRSIGIGWLVFAAILFEIGVRKPRTEFRFQAYVLAAGGIAMVLYSHVFQMWAHPWIPLACTLALIYGLVLRLRFVSPLPSAEQRWFDIAAGAVITAFSLLLFWHLAPGHYRGVFTCILMLVLFELGQRRLPATLTSFSYVAAGIASAVVVGEAAGHFLKPPPEYVWISYAGAALCFYLFSERVGKKQPLVQAVSSSIAAIFTSCAIWLVLPGLAVAPAWAIFAVILFVIGIRRDFSFERWQAYVMIVASILNAWHTGFHAAAATVVFACYLAQFLSPAEGQRRPNNWLGYLEKYPRVFWSLLGTISLTALLWAQFPGGWLTIAWGVEGMALLAAGFPLRQRVLRLQGLVILLVCILKLFLYDLRNLETIYRILSFVALGVILLGVSSIYTRFRERVSRYF